ncbi:MAG TPA: hypothetical protein VFF91_00745 [Pseudoxanthomonas sp.]|nr:hypothetical protein [Pseudoxanthomonas sp.]
MAEGARFPGSLGVAASMLAALATAGIAAAQPPRTPPHPGCMDARGLAEMHPAGPRTLAVRDRDGAHFRIDLAADCPVGEGEATVLARGGWVCGQADEYVRTAHAQCAVAGLARVDGREYAMLARQASRAAAGTLETVEVREARPRGFAASHSFCFNPRHVRGWSEDVEGMRVEVSPLRSGGYRYYRVELATSCPQLQFAPGVRFRSGLGIGVICGNPGDMVVAQARGEWPMSRGPARDEGIFAGTPASLPCAVSAVYPDVPRDPSR